MLEARGLTKYYSAIPAVRDVSFRICRGRRAGDPRSNGSGKSTTVSIVTGLLEPSGGTFYNGLDIRDDLLATRRRSATSLKKPFSTPTSRDRICRRRAAAWRVGQRDRRRTDGFLRIFDLQIIVEPLAVPIRPGAAGERVAYRQIRVELDLGVSEEAHPPPEGELRRGDEPGRLLRVGLRA